MWNFFTLSISIFVLFFTFSTVFSIGNHLKYFHDYSDLAFDIDLGVDGLPVIMEEIQ